MVHKFELRNLSKGYSRGSLVLDSVSLLAGEGEVIGVLGPSGCGKTTMLRCLAGFESPDAGEVLIDGRTVAGPAVFLPPEARNIGMVFQDSALFPHMTVEANIAYGLWRLPRAKARERTAALLETIGLTGKAKELPGRLSGGQKQRVALARALAPYPSILLMDEPFSSLDAGLRSVMRVESLAMIRSHRMTAVLVTHDPADAEAMCDRVVYLDGGRLVTERSCVFQ